MKKLLLIAALAGFAATAAAQTVPTDAAKTSEKLAADISKAAAAAAPADSIASDWKRHHNFELLATLQANLTSFDNWAPGGQNTIAGRGTLLAGDRYNRGRLWIINQFDTRYGINYIAKTTYKNEDELKYAFMALWKFSRTWAYSFTVNFRTQYSKGYLSPTDHTLISNFMAPGYIDVALGATYKKDGFPITFTISPIATSTMTVLDRTLSWQGLNGITPGHKARTLIGSSFKADYDQSFFDKTLRCRSSLYSFCDYKKAPNVRWENTITYGLGKYITASLYWLLFYDPYGTPPMLPKKLQSTYAAGLGLAYNFKNK